MDKNKSIELTPEMIEAGRKALAKWHFFDSDVVTEEDAIREIWKALFSSSASRLLRDAVIALLNAIQMEQHNEDIFKGKWKKGSKAWSGEFVAKMRKEAIDKGNAALERTGPHKQP